MPSIAFARFWQVDLTRECFLGFLSQDDLLSMRLVSQDFASTLAPRLFRELTLNFNVTCFARQARIAALGRIGYHVKKLNFHMPHTEDTFLPPLLDPESLREVSFVYEPRLQPGRPSSAGESSSRYGSWEVNDLLIRQYPLLFHAATNIPSFTQVLQAMPQLCHLRISCPNQSQSQTQRRDIVDYALISLRIAVEQANPTCLDTLSLDPVHPSATNYLRPQHTIGASPSSTRVWRRIKRLNIIMENQQQDFAHVDSSIDHLKTLHNYLSVFTSLRHFDFTWTGMKGPSPMSLNTEPCTSRPSSLNYLTSLPALSSSPPSLASSPSSASSSTSSFSFISSHKSITALRPIRFRHLRSMRLCNSTLDATQASTFIHCHRKTLSEFQFEACHLRTGTWDDALEPLTRMVGSDSWRKKQRDPLRSDRGSPCTSPCETKDKNSRSELRQRPTRPRLHIPERLSSTKLRPRSDLFFNEIGPALHITDEIMDVPLILSPEHEIPQLEFVQDCMWQPESCLSVFDDANNKYHLGGSWGRKKKSLNALRKLGEMMGLVGQYRGVNEGDHILEGDAAMEGVRRLLTGGKTKLF